MKFKTYLSALTLLMAAWHSAACFAQFQKTPWPSKQAAPVLRGIDQDGKAWDLAQLKGRAVVLNFWATWCAPCKEELPSLDSLSAVSQPEQTVVLTVNVNEPAVRALRYMQQAGLHLPVLSDPKGDIARTFGVRVFPTTLLIGADGKPKWRVVGAVDWSGQEAMRWLENLEPHR